MVAVCWLRLEAKPPTLVFPYFVDTRMGMSQVQGSTPWHTTMVKLSLLGQACNEEDKKHLQGALLIRLLLFATALYG